MQDSSQDVLTASAVALHGMEKIVGGLQGQGEEDMDLSGVPLLKSAERVFAALSRHITSMGDVDVTSKTGLHV